MSEDNSWLGSFPDFTEGESPEVQADRLVQTAKFLADEQLGESAVQLMQMIHWSIGMLDADEPYILERSEDEPPFFQVIQDPESGDWQAELSHENSCGIQQSEQEIQIVKSLGWIESNDGSPNWNRVYPAGASIYQIAADGAEGFIKGFSE